MVDYQKTLIKFYCYLVNLEQQHMIQLICLNKQTIKHYQASTEQNMHVKHVLQFHAEIFFFVFCSLQCIYSFGKYNDNEEYAPLLWTLLSDININKLIDSRARQTNQSHYIITRAVVCQVHQFFTFFLFPTNERYICGQPKPSTIIIHYRCCMK